MTTIKIPRLVFSSDFANGFTAFVIAGTIGLIIGFCLYISTGSADHFNTLSETVYELFIFSVCAALNISVTKRIAQRNHALLGLNLLFILFSASMSAAMLLSLLLRCE
jgi:hypothetical protein